jgi:hypothetical protein
MKMIVLLVIIIALVGPQTNALAVGEEDLHRPVVKHDNTIVEDGGDSELPRQVYHLADENHKVYISGSSGWDMDRRRRSVARGAAKPYNEEDHLSSNSGPKVVVKGIRTLGSGGWDIDRRRRNVVGGLDNSYNGKEHLLANPGPKVIVKTIRTLGSGGWDIDRRRRNVT